VYYRRTNRCQVKQELDPIWVRWNFCACTGLVSIPFVDQVAADVVIEICPFATDPW
jgi:hypothetical protein